MAFKFSTFDLHPDRRELRDGGKLVALPPKTFDVLCYLIENRDRMVPKAELLDKFWSRQVSEAALQKAISLLRKAMRCDGASVVRTHHGRGFRFVPAVLLTDQETTKPADTAPITLRERRLVSVLCLRLTTSDATAVSLFLKRAQARIEAHQGEAVRMRLDGFTASFGLAHSLEDAARRAVHCASELIAEAKDQDGLEPVIGIGHGSLDLDDQGDDTILRLPSGIERSAVTLAEQGLPGDILLSSATESHLRNEIESTPLDGKFNLTKLRYIPAGVPGRPLLSPAPFVGRRAELAFLEQSRDTLAVTGGQGIVLSGTAGIGKTRLLTEFLASLPKDQFRCVKLQCLPGLSNSPFAMIRELCQTLFRTPPAGTRLSDVESALVADLVGTDIPDPAVLASLSDHQRKTQSHALINRMLVASAAQTPLVVVFEDIHWLDTASRDCLDAMIPQADAAPLLVIMTTRPTDGPLPSETILQLAPLGHRDGMRLLRDNIPEAEIDNDTADALVRRAAGIPFFIEELALASQSHGDASQDLPETVQAVISNRIGMLDVDARAFLFVVAVIGPAARQQLVQNLLQLDAQSVEALSTRLHAMGFILPAPGTLSFRHMLIHDTAYAMLASAERQRLHGEIAAYLESDQPDWTSHPETLAWHHQEAGNADAGSAYWLKACKAATRRLAQSDAVFFAEKGLHLIRTGNVDNPKRELDLQIYLASALAAIRGYGAKDVGAAYKRARKINETLRDPRANIRILVGLWIYAWVAGRLQESLETAQDLLDVTKGTKDPTLRLQAHAGLGQVLLHTGRLTEGLQHLTIGTDVIADHPPASLPAQSAAVACTAYTSWSHALTGQHAEAKHFLALSEATAHAHENPLAQAIHFALCSETQMFMGDVSACLEFSDRAIDLSRAHDFPFWLGTGLVMRGWALGQQGDLATAFAAIDEGIAVFEATGAGVQLANWYGLKAETHLTAGQLQRAKDAADHALVCATKASDVYFTPRIHAVLARVHTALVAPERAEEHARLAAKYAAAYGMAPSVITLLI